MVVTVAGGAVRGAVRGEAAHFTGWPSDPNLDENALFLIAANACCIRING
jgi:hypothetical protein